MGASATSGIMIGVCMFGEWGPCSVQRVGLEFEFTFGFAVNVGCVCVCLEHIGAPCFWIRAPLFGHRASGWGWGCYSELESACSSSIGLDLEFDSNSHAVEAGD